MTREHSHLQGEIGCSVLNEAKLDQSSVENSQSLKILQATGTTLTVWKILSLG